MVCHCADLGKSSTGESSYVETVDYIPAGMLYDPVFLLNQCAPMFRSEGVVIVPTVPGPYGDPAWDGLDYPDRLRRLMQAVRTDGWECTDTAADNSYGWLTFTRRNKAAITLGIVEGITVDHHQLVDPTDLPETTAQLLSRYQAATGVAWRGTPGISGIQMIRALWDRPTLHKGKVIKRDQPLWIERLDDPDKLLTGCGDIMWNADQPRRNKAATYTGSTFAAATSRPPVWPSCPVAR